MIKNSCFVTGREKNANIHENQIEDLLYQLVQIKKDNVDVKVIVTNN